MTPLRWFRVTFYPCAALLGAFLLWGGPGGGKDTGSVLYGATAQGAPLRMNLDAGGRPVAFETTIDARCTDDSLWFFRWKGYSGDPRSFRFRDGHLEVAVEGAEAFSDKRGRFVLTMSADVDGESRAEGTVKLVEDFTTTEGERYSCPSGPVRFSAQR